MRELITAIRSKRPVTLLLAAANILVFIVLSLMGDTESASFMGTHGACWLPAVKSGEYWRILTSMFLHFGAVHLLYNMLCLMTLGDLYERVAGPVRFTVIYFLGGIAGNLVSLAIEQHTGQYAVSAGASGAIFAVIGALLWAVIRKRGRLGNIRLDRMILMTVLMVAEGFFEKGTDNAAHIGGVAAGFVLGMILYRG